MFIMADLLQGIVSAVTAPFASAASAVQKATSNVASTVQKTASDVVQSAYTTASNISQGATSVAGNVAGNISSAGQNVISAASRSGSDASSIATKLAQNVSAISPVISVVTPLAAPAALTAGILSTSLSTIQKSSVPATAISSVPAISRISATGAGLDIGSPITSKTIAQNISKSDTTTVYMPYGNYAQIAIEKAKVGVDVNTGEVGVYQQARGHSIFNLVGGASRGGAQSGTITLGRPETPIVYTQESGGTKLASTANASEAAKILTNTGLYSRLGAEAYGGYVTPLDSRTIQSTKSEVGVFSNASNLANYVSASGVNLSKSEAPGATIPWSVSETTPTTFEFSDLTNQTVWKTPGYKVSGAGADVVQKGGVASLVSTLAPETTTTIVKPTGAIDIPILGSVVVPGVSNVLAFLQPEKSVETSKSVSKSLTGSLETTTTTKLTKSTEIAGSSGLDRLNTEIRKTLNLPSIKTGEQAVELTSATALSAIPVIGATAQTTLAAKSGLYNIIGDAIGISKEKQTESKASVVSAFEALEPLRGQYTQFYENPLLSVGSYVVGAGIGTAAGAAEKAYMLGRASLAEKIISGGQSARVIEQVGGTIVSRAPQALAALYAADIAGRSTSGFTSFDASTVSSKAKGIIGQEAVPMALGAKLPSQIYSGAKGVSYAYKDVKMAIAEERTKALTGVTDISASPMEAVATKVLAKDVSAMDVARYVAEPKIAGVVESVKGPASNLISGKTLGIAKINYKSYLQEKGVSSIPELMASKTKTAATQIYEKIYPKYFEAKLTASTIPETTQRGIWGAYGKVYDIKQGITELPSALKTTASGLKSSSAYISKLVGKRAYLTKEYALAKAEEFGMRMSGSSLSGTTVEPALAYGSRTTVGETIENVAFGKSLSRILEPTTFGEVKPFGLTYVVSTGNRGDSTKTTTRGGGAPGETKTEMSRITSKIIGGKLVSGLKAEPSLRSTGVSEVSKTEATGFTRSRVTDYRGTASEVMKPMDLSKAESKSSGVKQSAGLQSLVITEQLPLVEGATAKSITLQPPKSRLNIFDTFITSIPSYAQQEVVATTSTELTPRAAQQSAAQSQLRETRPITGISTSLLQVPSRRELSVALPSVVQSRKDTISVIPSVAYDLPYKQAPSASFITEQIRTQTQTQESMRVREPSSTTVPRQKEDVTAIPKYSYRTDVIPKTTTVRQPTQDTTTRLTTTTPISTITPTIVTIPRLTGSAFGNGGGGSTSEKRGGAFRFVNIYRVGIGISNIDLLYGKSKQSSKMQSQIKYGSNTTMPLTLIKSSRRGLQFR